MPAQVEGPRLVSGELEVEAEALSWDLPVLGSSHLPISRDRRGLGLISAVLLCGQHSVSESHSRG